MALFKPAWMGDNEKKALRAVEKEENQSKLYEIAKKAPEYGVRTAAVKKLTDQNLIYDVAKNDRDFLVRMAAAEKLTDQLITISIVYLFRFFFLSL